MSVDFVIFIGGRLRVQRLILFSMPNDPKNDMSLSNTTLAFTKNQSQEIEFLTRLSAHHEPPGITFLQRGKQKNKNQFIDQRKSLLKHICWKIPTKSVFRIEVK